MSSMTSHQSAEVQFVMFYWLYKTRIGGRSYSSTTHNSLDFYINKTKQHLHTYTFCHLLGLENTSSAAYHLGETQTSETCKYFSLLFGREDSAEILASVWQEEENVEVLKRCYIQMYPTRF